MRLHQSQLRVEQLPQYPRPNDLAAAQLALIQAQEAVSAADGKLEQLRARPHPRRSLPPRPPCTSPRRTCGRPKRTSSRFRATPGAGALAERTRDVELAHAELQAAEARQAQLEAGVPAPTLAAAERDRQAKAAALEAAQVKLTTMLAGPSPAVIAELEAAVAEAEATLRARQQPYTAEQLDAQQQAVAEAEAALRQQRQPQAPAALEQQRAQAHQAEQQLALLRSPPPALELVDLDQALDQARARLAEARHRRDAARLVAPFDAVVVQVGVPPGERIGGGEVAAAGQATGAGSSGSNGRARDAAVVLVDVAAPRVELGLSGTDVLPLALGQRAVVTAEACPGELAGVVSRLVPLSAPRPDEATYQAQVTLDAPPPLPLGASVRVTIAVDARDDVLVVPTRALHRAGAATAVLRVDGADVTPRPVTVGLTAGALAEIVGGLAEGDVVLIDDSPGSPAGS